jgi:maleate isomerase
MGHQIKMGSAMPSRVGLIIPSSNRMVEQEMVQTYPDGVRAHVTRLRMTGDNRGPLEPLLPRVEEAARALADAKCELITFHCTANSMQEGRRGEERLLKAMANGGAVRASTTATAVRRTLAALDARRIVLATPYDQETTDHEVEFLREAGYQVIHAVGFDLGGADAYCATPPAFWRERVAALARPDADVYFISCAAIPVLGVIEELEALVDRPVITSNQVVIWDALGELRRGNRRGLPGRLFMTTGGADAIPALQP